MNPLREGLSMRNVAQPCIVVIFGATGDLTMRKLIPALYNITADGEMPPGVAVVGFARREKTDEQFRTEQEETTRKFSRQQVRDDVWKQFAGSLFYHQSEFHDAEGYKRLVERLNKLDDERGTGGNWLLYLAVAPDQDRTQARNDRDPDEAVGHAEESRPFLGQVGKPGAVALEHRGSDRLRFRDLRS